MNKSKKETVVLLDNVETTVSTEKFIVVFDICSSSQIIEDLQNHANMKEWDKFLFEITLSIDSYINKNGIKAFIYKFLGDGYILIIDKACFDKVLAICFKIYQIILDRLKKLIEVFSNIEPVRIGITIGIDFGRIHKIKIQEQDEYVGKSINTASRLQTSLKDKEHENKLLISKIVKKAICGPYKSDLYKETTRQMRNLYGENRFYCYEIDLSTNLNDFVKAN